MTLSVVPLTLSTDTDTPLKCKSGCGEANQPLSSKGHCYKPDQRQTWNPFYLWTAGPKLLKQLGVFRLSSAELWERSLAINGGQAVFMDAEVEQTQQQTARPFPQLCPWLHCFQRWWAEHRSDCSGTKRMNEAILHWTAPQKHHHFVEDPSKSCQKKSWCQHQTGCSLTPPHRLLSPTPSSLGNPAGSAAAGPSCSQRLTKNPTLQQDSAAPGVI